MTNDNYIEYSNQQLLDEVKSLNISNICLNRMLMNHYPKLYLEIVNRTNFLVSKAFEHNSIPIQARLYCLEHNIHSHPTCKNPTCPDKNLVGWSKANLEFQHHCCNACSNKDPNTIQKAEQTNLKNLGVKNAFQSEEKKIKIRQTNLKNLGVENPSQSKDIQRKKEETTLKHFNVRYPGQSKIIKEKIKRTNLERRGVEWSVLSDEVKRKSKHTIRIRYNVEFASQSEHVKEKFKQTCRRKWNVDNPFQAEEIKQKCKETCIKHYNVDNFSKSPLFSTYTRKRIFHDNIWFDSNWEVKVYNFLKENNISFEYSPALSYPYEYDDRQFTYHPDFIINGKVYEVKGDQFFRMNESTGKEEMFCPYGRKKYGEEKWQWRCRKEEAKHQCMLKNNVHILRDMDIRCLSISTFIS